MTLSFYSAASLSAGNSFMREKLSVAFPGRKVFFAFYEVSDHLKHKIEVTPQKIAGVKKSNQASLQDKGKGCID